MSPDSPPYFFFSVLEIILYAAPTLPYPPKKLDITCFTERFMINHSNFSCDYLVKNKMIFLKGLFTSVERTVKLIRANKDLVY